jgi:hypothetical protein
LIYYLGTSSDPATRVIKKLEELIYDERLRTEYDLNLD